MAPPDQIDFSVEARLSAPFAGNNTHGDASPYTGVLRSTFRFNSVSFETKMPSKCNTETEAKPSAGGIIYKSKHDGKWYRMELNRSSWKFQSYGELIPLAILEGEDEADKKKARQQNVDFTNAMARARKKQKDEMKNDKEYREKSEEDNARITAVLQATLRKYRFKEGEDALWFFDSKLNEYALPKANEHLGFCYQDQRNNVLLDTETGHAFHLNDIGLGRKIHCELIHQWNVPNDNQSVKGESAMIDWANKHLPFGVVLNQTKKGRVAFISTILPRKLEELKETFKIYPGLNRLMKPSEQKEAERRGSGSKPRREGKQEIKINWMKSAGLNNDSKQPAKKMRAVKPAAPTKTRSVKAILGRSIWIDYRLSWSEIGL
ncbi:hypothetical protein ACHAWO_009168 [Cyclotella atomus]|uniref:Uncharacterized protein n=1 Tax=Cyclotella atomus TaxID=382360 RepID=A0ABD3N7U3_9STRA